MATSSSWNYSMSAADVIKAAYEDLGVLVPGGTVAAADSTMALTRLNMLVKQWQGISDMAPGLKVWTRQRVVLFLEKGKQRYLIGPASTDAFAATVYGKTTIDAAEGSGQTTLSVAATSDTTTFPGTTVTMTASDIILVQQDDGTFHDSTIASIVAGDTVTIDDATTDSADGGNKVYWFTSRAQRFPVIEFAVLRESDETETPLIIYRDVSQYESIMDKYADGDPTAILVEPLRIATAVTLDAQPDDVTKQIVMSVLYPAEDYDSTADDIAFPQEWYAALAWELAFRLSPSVGRWTREMESNRQSAIALARAVNPENTFMHFQPGEY
jgi:hypothetical protein